MYNKLNLFVIAQTYMCLGVNACDWMTYQGPHHWQKLIFSLSEAIHSCCCVLLLF